MPDIQTEVHDIGATLNEIRLLLRYSIVVQLYKAGATQAQIAENLHLGIHTVNDMVKGMKKTSSE